MGEEEIPHLHVPNSVPILYRFERQSQKILSTKLQSAAGGSHARWLLSPENHASIRKAILPGGLLTRAVIDSWDLDRTGVLSVGEIEAGIKAMLSPHVERGQSASCAVIAVAKKIVRPPSLCTPRPAPTALHPPPCTHHGSAPPRHHRDTRPAPAAPSLPRISARPWRPRQVRELPADASMTVDDIEHMAAAEVADINGAVVQQNAADLMGRGPIYGEEVNDFSTAPPLSY